jgi:hypothetical protein
MKRGCLSKSRERPPMEMSLRPLPSKSCELLPIRYRPKMEKFGPLACRWTTSFGVRPDKELCGLKRVKVVLYP